MLLYFYDRSASFKKVGNHVIDDHVVNSRRANLKQFLSERQWRSQPKNFGGAKMFDFRRITLFCMEKRLSKHKKTIFSKQLWGYGPFVPPGYTYGER